MKRDKDKEEDRRRLASGEITANELQRENAVFAFPNMRIDWAAYKKKSSPRAKPEGG